MSVAGIAATQEAHGKQLGEHGKQLGKHGKQLGELGELKVSVAGIAATQEAHGKQLDRLADPGERAPLSTAS